MNKLTLVSMAVLCLLMSSCSDYELETTHSTESQLQSRSATPATVNAINVTYVTQEGLSSSISCTRAAINYSAGGAQMIFTFSDSTTVAVVGDEVSLSTGDLYELELTTASGVFSSSDLSVEQCETTLCYENSTGSIIGAALEFIVEDDNVAI